MRESPLRLVKRSAEFILKENLKLLPKKLRGIYVLYKQSRVRGVIKYDVLYVGMATAGRRGGVSRHAPIVVIDLGQPTFPG
jgi:hypothetical protein